MAKTPKIRFKNFSDEWVENKYKNIGQCLSGGTLSYEDLDKNGIYKCILYGELYTRYDYIIKNIVFRTNKLGNKVIKNDILFPQSTTVDAISLISPACMNDDEAQTSGVFAIRPHKNIDGNFITYYTKGNFYQRNKLAKNAQGLTIVHLYYQSIKDETILIPNLAEQCKISEFFTKLDKLIALHQNKFEKLQKIKKSCLQNLFPQNNQNTPKIRFKNFSDEWENNNLGEICKIIKGEQINKLSLLENGKYYVLNGGISPSGYINTYNTLENTISISEGGNSCGYVKFNIEKFWSGGHNYTLNELKTKTLFLYSFLKAKQQKIMALRVGSGLPNIQKNTLSNISISIPNSKEQEKIGAFFSKLDKLISLHQSKFEKLQKIKKSCLQNMFV
ncbi:restriction endonuclease subunit S [Campylobacter sp.]